MSKRFVLVDDDEDVLLILQSLLEIEGHTVVTFGSSQKALDYVVTESPDCVLTDLMMPQMDGIELCQKLRSYPHLHALRIVVVSGKVYQTDKERALKAGANGFVSKSRSQPDRMLKDIMAVFRETLTAQFWGSRGTMPVSGPGSLRYGGNTACVSLTFPDGHLFVFDAGTGISALAKSLMGSGRKVTGSIFISHPHWDHLNYLPFFTPLYVPGHQFEILGSPHEHLSLEQLVANQMDGVHFPITPREFGARLSYRELGEGRYSVGPAQVETMLLCHPGFCLGYRVEYGGKRFAYVTDNELFLPDHDSYSPSYEKNLVKFMADCDICITDTSYSDSEYKTRVGWGHSACSRVVALAHQAEVKQLFLFHHVPEHDDSAIERMLQDAQEQLEGLASHTQVRAALAEEEITF
jgi:CheY-like chemotaxis protein